MNDDCLVHYGVPGMRKGVRKQRPTSPRAARRAAKKAAQVAYLKKYIKNHANKDGYKGLKGRDRHFGSDAYKATGLKKILDKTKKVDRKGNKISENDRLLKAKKRYNRNIALGTAVGIAGTIGASALGSYISKKYSR